MKITRVNAVYFSATGNTQKVVTSIAKQVADALQLEYHTHDFTLPDKRKEPISFGETDLVIVGLPVYAGRIPNLLLPYVRDSISGNGALGVPVVLYGNRNFDDALIELRDVMEQNGFHTIAAGGFIGEHSFSKILGAGRPDAADMEVAAELGARIIARVENPSDGPIAVRGEQPIRPYYTPRDRKGTPINILKVKPKTSEDCIQCGICAAVCPMGAISKDNAADIPGTCTKCCACEKKCPVGAKYFDDPGYIYHKIELEEQYSRRAEPEIF